MTSRWSTLRAAITIEAEDGSATRMAVAMSVPEQQATVGFVGLGNMGWPMAGNLHAAGFRLVVRDIEAGKQDRFAAEHPGAIAAASPDAFASAGAGAVAVALLEPGRTEVSVSCAQRSLNPARKARTSNANRRS